MDEFRVLHVSDFHIATRPRVLGFPDFLHNGDFPAGSIGLFSASSYDPHLADLVARQVLLKAPNLDLILVTGDEATTGGQADLALARRYCADAALPGVWWSAPQHPTIRQPGGPPVVLLPGNHDRFTGVLKNAGGTAFDATFSAFWGGPGTARTLAVLQGAGGAKLAFVGADFTLASNGDAEGVGGHFGQGRAYDRVVQALLAETDQVRGRHAPVAVVWAVHFPPFFPNISRLLKLVDEAKLTAAAARAGVGHVLCGHTHTKAEYDAGDGIHVHCAGTATQYYAPSPNVIHVRNFSVDGTTVAAVTSTDLTWDQRGGDFK